MPRFRSKPREVEAIQWFPGTDVPGVFVEDPYRRELEVMEPDLPPGLPVRYFVVTIHRQRAYLEPGDWVVTEPDGKRHYPVKDEIFRETYTPVEP
jgi:hypothetical protein